MRRGIHNDVRQVLVDEAVDDFASVPLAVDDPGGLQHAQVLADQRLGDAEGVDEFVHATFRDPKLQDDRDPDGRGERAEQFTRFDKDVLVAKRRGLHRSSVV